MLKEHILHVDDKKNPLNVPSTNVNPPGYDRIT